MPHTFHPQHQGECHVEPSTGHLQRCTQSELRADSCGSAPFQYETNSDEVRRQFEEHGEIKTFFDLIANRGMVFVTFVGV